MKKEEEKKYFDLMDIWHIFIWHIFPIMIAAVICVAGVYVYTHFFKVPKYKSTATIYILKQKREGNYAYTQSDFSLALNVVNDCVYMLKSSEVLDEAIDELGLQMSVSSLTKCITTRNPEGTRILEVSVETTSPEQAKRIVDAICRIGAEKISATMSMDQVNIYSLGKVPTTPSNTTGIIHYVLIGIGAALLVYFVYFVAFLIDDKLKTEEDIERYLNLTVLSVIPNAEDVAGKKYKKYRKYKSYGNGKYRPYKYGAYGKTSKSAAVEMSSTETDRGISNE